MARPPPLYKRLTRATASLGSYRSLWLGPDHLLVVKSTGYVEEYRRIQFKNIQAIFLVASQRRGSWAIFWLFLAVFGGILAALNFSTTEFPVKSVILGSIGMLGAIWNHLLGPSCKVYLMTGVQTLQLPSLVRRRKAGKVLKRIEPLIAEAQRAAIGTPGAAPLTPELPRVPLS